jgi:hypothetical protein
MSFPSFTTGEVLTASDMNAVGLWLIKTASFSGATSHEITSVFSADYDNYRIYVNNLQIATGGSNTVFMRMGTGGAISNTQYYLGGSFTSYAAVQGALNLNNATSGWYTINAANTADSSFEMTLYRPNIAEATSFTCQGVEGLNSAWQTGGIHNVNTAYTGFTLSALANISGTYYVYGLKD